MNTKVMVKLILIAMLASILSACGMMPSVDEVFVDQRDEYKKAHELPPLEIPPELSGSAIKDEYDGATKNSVVSSSSRASVQTTPLSEEQPRAELIKKGVDSYLLVRDSLRNTWRKTISALEEKSYDIEDKNRQTSLVYLNIAKDSSSSSMLSSLSFWKRADTDVYILELKRAVEGVEVRVLDEEKTRIDNDISQSLLAELLAHLVP